MSDDVKEAKAKAVSERYDKRTWNYAKEGELWDAIKEVYQYCQDLENKISKLSKEAKK